MIEQDINFSPLKTNAKDFVTTLEEVIEQKKDDLATKSFVKQELYETKIDLIKWGFALFMAIALLVIGLYFKR